MNVKRLEQQFITPESEKSTFLVSVVGAGKFFGENVSDARSPA